MNLIARSDEEIVAGLKAAVLREQRSLSDVLEHLAAVDQRRLYEPLAFTSLFDYCTRELGYSESAAGKRICAARLARKHERLFAVVREGLLHLEGLVILSPVLSSENFDRLIGAARGKPKREIERLVAAIAPEVPAFDLIRRMPEVSASPTAAAAERFADLGSPGASGVPRAIPEMIRPVSASQHRVAFTAGDAFVGKLRTVKELMSRKFAEGGLEAVLEETIDVWLARRQSSASTTRTTWPGARRIPRGVELEVRRRDEGRCVFVSADGRRCEARAFLELDHIKPWSLGGASNDPENIRLLCGTHNRMLARNRFGAYPKTG